MKIFITGGAGFIGSHLCLHLLNEGHQVTAYDNLLLGKKEFLKSCEIFKEFKFIQKDLLNYQDLKSAMSGHDLVYHLAANSDISLGGKQTDVDLKLGTLVTYNVCEAMRENNIKKIVFASTSAIYGEADIKPTPETYGPLLPISFYGASKLACEALITAFSHNYDVQCWIYRFANIVGSHSTHGAIHDFLKRLKQNPDVLKVLGNGTQKKSYLHVTDCISGMEYGFKNIKDQVNFFNLASEGVTEVRNIAEQVVEGFEKETGKKAKIEFGTEDRGWKGDVPVTWLDGSKLQKAGWKSKMNSNAAVKQAIQDIINEMK